MKSIYMGLFLLATQALAAPAPAPHAYEVDVNYSLDGTRVSLPRLTVAEGSTTAVENGDSFVELQALEEKPGILLLFTVGHLDAEGRRVAARPQLIVREGEPASFRTGDAADGSVEVGVTARRL